MKLRKTTLLASLASLFVSGTFAQDKPKSSKNMRDSVFTVMKLSNENRKK